MTDQQQADLDALHRLRKFLDDTSPALGAINASRSRAAFDELVIEDDCWKNDA